MADETGGRITGVYKVGDDERSLPESLSEHLSEADNDPDTFNDGQGNARLSLSNDYIHAPGDTFQDGRMAAIMAQQRGWQEINLQGSEDFKRGAYIEGEARELDTTGYKHTTADNAARAERNREYLANESVGLETGVEAINTAEVDQARTPRSSQAMSDASLDQGATDAQEGDQALASGERGTAALQSAPDREGEQHGARPAADTPAGALERSEAVRSMTPKELVEAYPDMRREAGVIAAADAFAAEKIGSADDQARFTGSIREQVAERVAQGEQVADMSVKESRAVERQAERTTEAGKDLER